MHGVLPDAGVDTVSSDEEADAVWKPGEDIQKPTRSFNELLGLAAWRAVRER